MRRRALLASAASVGAAATAGCLGVDLVGPRVRVTDAHTGYDPEVFYGDAVGWGDSRPAVVVGSRANVDDPGAHRRRTVVVRTGAVDRRLALAVEANGQRVYLGRQTDGDRTWRLVGFLEPGDYRVLLESPRGAASSDAPDRHLPDSAAVAAVTVDSFGPEPASQLLQVDTGDVAGASAGTGE
jgi:hypothetical protein